MNDLGYFLFSGGAEGCDEVFEKSAADGKVFLPWNGFRDRFHGEKKNGIEYVVPGLNYELVRQYHPNPKALSNAGWKFMSRNSYQVLGPDLKSPVDFVVCWTPSGKDEGGTAQACRIARSKNIPVYNLENSFERRSLFAMMKLKSFEV